VIKQKIAVTGANGQVGMELRTLSAAYPGFDFIFLAKEDLSIDNEQAVQDFFKKYHPHYFINAAAYTAVDKAETEKDLAYQVNANAPGLLAAVCKDYGCTFIHISTDYVFDGTSTIPYKETAPVNPMSVYGASKLEGEKQVQEFNDQAIIIRTAWVYSSFGKNFVKTILRLLKEKESINVVNDQVGSPTYAADLADAILIIIKKLQHGEVSLSDHAGIYHYSNSGIISWYDFAVAIKELSGSACQVNPIPTTGYPTPAKRPAYSALSTEKIKDAFGIVPRGWKDSLQVCISLLQ
jgi:dTDP-4-dehydrorhamnose reductase